jgi:hypothetical protein
LFLFPKPPLDEFSFYGREMRSKHPAVSFDVFAAGKYEHVTYIVHEVNLRCWKMADEIATLQTKTLYEGAAKLPMMAGSANSRSRYCPYGQ